MLHTCHLDQLLVQVTTELSTKCKILYSLDIKLNNFDLLLVVT